MNCGDGVRLYVVEAAARKVTADMVAEETPDLNSFLDKVVLELTASAISHTELKTEAPKTELETEVQMAQIIGDLDGLIANLNSTSSDCRVRGLHKYVGHQPHIGYQPHNSRRDGVSA